MQKFYNMFELQVICKEMIKVASATSEWIKEERKSFKRESVEAKGVHDYVTYVDKGAEEKIVNGLRKIVPEAGFIAEEGTETNRSERFNWIIDPIDGTTNFIHGLSPYCISIALADGDEIVAGVVHEVTQNESFFAWKDGGAYLNGEPIKVSDEGNIKTSFVATGFPYDAYDRLEPFMKSLSWFFVETPGVRRLGSAAADLAYVACGRFDCFYEYNLNPWDVAAGIILVSEAGGKLSDFKGGNNYLFGREIVAANNNIFEPFLTEIKRFFN